MYSSKILYMQGVKVKKPVQSSPVVDQSTGELVKAGPNPGTIEPGQSGGNAMETETSEAPKLTPSMAAVLGLSGGPTETQKAAIENANNQTLSQPAGPAYFPPVKKGPAGMYCELCEITGTSNVMFETHLAGKKHRSKYQKALQDGLIDPAPDNDPSLVHSMRESAPKKKKLVYNLAANPEVRKDMNWSPWEAPTEIQPDMSDQTSLWTTWKDSGEALSKKRTPEKNAGAHKPKDRQRGAKNGSRQGNNRPHDQSQYSNQDQDRYRNPYQDRYQNQNQYQDRRRNFDHFQNQDCFQNPRQGPWEDDFSYLADCLQNVQQGPWEDDLSYLAECIQNQQQGPWEDGFFNQPNSWQNKGDQRQNDSFQNNGRRGGRVRWQNKYTAGPNEPSVQSLVPGLDGWKPPKKQQPRTWNQRPEKPRVGPPCTSVAELFCAICDVTSASPQIILDHIAGKKHGKKELIYRCGGVSNLGKDMKSVINKRLFCDVCDLYVMGYITMKSHVESKKHLSRLQKIAVGKDYLVAKNKWAVPVDGWEDFDYTRVGKRKKDDGGWGLVREKNPAKKNRGEAFVAESTIEIMDDGSVKPKGYSDWTSDVFDLGDTVS